MRSALYKPPNLPARWPADIPQDLLCVHGWMLRAEPCRAWKVGAESGQNDKLDCNIAEPPGISGLGQPFRTALCCGLEPDIYPPTLETATEDCSLRDCDQGLGVAVLLGLAISWNAL